VLDGDNTGAAGLRAISGTRLANPVKDAADLAVAAMIVEAGRIRSRGPAPEQRGVIDYLCLRDDYLELLEREKQTEADRPKTDRNLG
jgi:hypothetical protein